MAGMLLRSATSDALVPLTPSGVGGGESVIYWLRDDPTKCAAAPAQGTDSDWYWAKVESLREIPRPHPCMAWPLEVLVDLADRTTRRAWVMDKLPRNEPGETLELLLVPAERARLGLTWGKDEWVAVALLLCALFAATDRACMNQNDCHPANYAVAYHPVTKRPTGVYRYDPLSASYVRRGQYSGCAAARWEYLPPELQKVTNLAATEIPRAADHYALACLIFQCLTGGEPWGFAGGAPIAAERVAKKQFVGFSVPHGAKVPDAVLKALFDLPTELLVLFERAFLGDPNRRPQPREWKQALRVARDGGKQPADEAAWLPWAFFRDRALPRVTAFVTANRWGMVGSAALVLAGLSLPTESPPLRTVSAPSVPAASGMLPPPARLPPPVIPHPSRRPTDRDVWMTLNR